MKTVTVLFTYLIKSLELLILIICTYTMIHIYFSSLRPALTVPYRLNDSDILLHGIGCIVALFHVLHNTLLNNIRLNLYIDYSTGFYCCWKPFNYLVCNCGLRE